MSVVWWGMTWRNAGMVFTQKNKYSIPSGWQRKGELRLDNLASKLRCLGRGRGVEGWFVPPWKCSSNDAFDDDELADTGSTLLKPTTLDDMEEDANTRNRDLGKLAKRIEFWDEEAHRQKLIRTMEGMWIEGFKRAGRWTKCLTHPHIYYPEGEEEIQH
jgi:hypothetical protein